MAYHTIILKLFFRLGKFIFDKIPTLRPILTKGKILTAKDYWGMRTFYAPPNNSKIDELFNTALVEVGKFNESNPHSYDQKTIDGSLWRFWYVAFAARHALRTGNNTFVECGVGMGYTAFFAMSQPKNFTMHLYDAWDSMKASALTKAEQNMSGFYKDLDLNTTKQNLGKFNDMIVYHKGYIPDTLDQTAPEKISYLHIDLNSSKATKQALEFFLPRLVRGGVIIFDEYGYPGYEETKQVIDDILPDLLKLPTGQAMHFV